MKAKNIALVCMTAYILGHNIGCHNKNTAYATWGKEQVEIQRDTGIVKTTPRYVNYAVKIGPESDQFIIMNENNIYLRQSKTGIWKQGKCGYEDALDIKKYNPPRRYTQIGVLENDTIHAVNDTNLLVGFDGIGGYEPVKSR